MVLPWLDLVIVDRLSHDPLGADNLTIKTNPTKRCRQEKQGFKSKEKYCKKSDTKLVDLVMRPFSRRRLGIGSAQVISCRVYYKK